MVIEVAFRKLTMGGTWGVRVCLNVCVCVRWVSYRSLGGGGGIISSVLTWWHSGGTSSLF